MARTQRVESRAPFHRALALQPRVHTPSDRVSTNVVFCQSPAASPLRRDPPRRACKRRRLGSCWSSVWCFVVARRAFSQPGKGEPQKLASSRATDLRHWQAPAKTGNLTGPRTTCRNQATAAARESRGANSCGFHLRVSASWEYGAAVLSRVIIAGHKRSAGLAGWPGADLRARVPTSIASASGGSHWHRDATGTASGSWLNRRPVASKTVTRDPRDTV
jgi:hypothetical protein